jgi:hypothetical protein
MIMRPARISARASSIPTRCALGRRGDIRFPMIDAAPA